MSITSTSIKTFQFPEVRVVEASAGSGKTYALAKRYVQLLLMRPDLGEGRSSNTLSPEGAKGYLQHENVMRSILAITFTNKAALEMKSRIIDFLKRIALGTMPQAELKEIVGPIELSPVEARAKSYGLMEQLIRQYNFFQVQTIDSFIKTLLIGCCFKTGLTAGFRIRTNSPEYLEYALDELIDTAQNSKSSPRKRESSSKLTLDPRLRGDDSRERGDDSLGKGPKNLRRMFEDFLHNYIYLENRSGWFPKKDMLDILRALFAQYNNYGLDFKTSGVSAEEIIKLKKSILKDIKSLQKDLFGDRHLSPKGTSVCPLDQRFMTSYEKFISEHDVGFDIDSVPSWFEREEPPIKKGTAPFFDRKKGRCPLFETWAKIRNDLKKVCEAEAHSLFNPYAAIFRETMTVFDKISTKEDVLFLEELNRRARELFKRGDISVGELYYRLATRFRHYLLDEFQDTSRLQWKNIEPMALEALSSGGSLFYVGDKKQAIYSFRGGEVELFDETREGLKDYNVQVEPLAKNWRSQKAIVEFNNAVFSFDNLKGFINRKEAFEREKKKKAMVCFNDDDLQVLERAFANSQQTFKPENSGGYVKIEHLDIDKKGERDDALRQRIVPLIKDLRPRFALSDIAILTRNNKEVEQVTGWLLAENIFVESERTSNIRENPVIQEVVCFLKFLDSPIDNLSFAQFILGECFAKSISSPPPQPSPQGGGSKKNSLQKQGGDSKNISPPLVGGARNGEDVSREGGQESMHDFVFSVRGRVKNEKDFYIYMAFREKYPKQWQELFEEFFKNVGLYPMYEMVVSIYNRFGVLKNFPEYQGFLMRFLELIKREEEDHSGITSFIEYFENLEGEDLFVHLTDTDAVKVTTIHKSKGLEFPVVILPFLCMDIEVGEGVGDGQQSYVPQKSEETMELLRLKSKYYSYSDELYEIYSREYKRAFLNELNTIYVALTRPMYELYGFISNKVGQSHNPVRLLIQEEICESGRLTACHPEESRKSGPTSQQGRFQLPLNQNIRKAGSKDLEILRAAKSGAQNDILKLPPSEHHDWIGYLEDEFAPFDQLKNRSQRLRGSVIHFMLSFIGNLSCHPEGERSSTEGSRSFASPFHGSAQDDNKRQFLELALSETALNYPGLENLKEHLAFVEKLIDDPELKPFMYVEDAEVQTELEVVNRVGHTKRFDRLIIKNKAKEIWIVDFKSSAQDSDGKYQAQVKEYIAILKELHPQYKVKGFLVYMDEVRIEEVE